MKKNITIRKLDEKGDISTTVSIDELNAFLEQEQGNGNFLYIPESTMGVYTPHDKLPRIQDREIEILVFPPVMGG